MKKLKDYILFLFGSVLILAFVGWSLYDFIKELPELLFAVYCLIRIAITFAILYVIIKSIVKVINYFIENRKNKKKKR